ncbi:UNVERIFIED_CONTAM: hypothetical protein GTU68_045198, partial [Idotea baltica]|nr:hypothetical protein [Idotea baltica]
NPLEVAKEFEAAGIEYLHVVDLDGAKASEIINYKVLEQIAIKTNLKIDFGGGLKSDKDLEIAFNSGANQITGGSIAVKNQEIFESWITKYGSEKIILGADFYPDAIGGKIATNGWQEESTGGTIPTKLNLFDWAKEVEKRGAGEILFTSMNNDGTKAGFANEALAKLSTELNIPIIASGGAGTVQHFVDTFKIGKSDAALAASVFHFGEIPILELKKELKKENIPVRL